MKNNFLPILVFVLVGFLIYSNSLRGEFIADDYVYIVENPVVKDVTAVKEIFKSFNTRFLVGLSFAFNYWLGQFDVFGYHFINVLCHIFATYVVYQFVRLIFKTPYLERRYTPEHAQTVAVFSSLIFLVHPLQTEAVSYISQRSTSLGAAVYLGTIIFYLKGRLENKLEFFIAALVINLLGFFVKEMIINVVVVLFVCEFFFFGPIKKDTQARLSRLLPFILILPLFGVIVSFDHTRSVSQLKYMATLSRFDWNYLFTEINVLRTYLRFFVLPINQTHTYDYKIADGFFEPSTLLSCSLLIGLLAWALMQYDKRRMFSFCIVWFFITTSIESLGVAFGNRDVIYDRWLYLPMVGFSIFLVTGVYQISKGREFAKKILIVIISIFCVMTYQRNKVWQTEICFWQDNIKKAPKMEGPYLALGRAYQRKGQIDAAIWHYQKAIDLKPDYVKAINNLGAVYYEKGDHRLAKQYFNQAKAIAPSDGKIYNNLAFVYFNQNKCPQAIKFYEKSIELQGDYPEAYLYMGQCHVSLNSKKEAKKLLKKAMILYERFNDQKGQKRVKQLLKDLP